EITLRGRVWPIAGLKEKLVGAWRGGIKTVLIPEENAKDLVEIADSIKSGLEIVPVSRMDEVLARAMTHKPEPIEWDETTTTATAVSEEAPVEEEASTLTAHLNDRGTGGRKCHAPTPCGCVACCRRCIVCTENLIRRRFRLSI